MSMYFCDDSNSITVKQFVDAHYYEYVLRTGNMIKIDAYKQRVYRMIDFMFEWWDRPRMLKGQCVKNSARIPIKLENLFAEIIIKCPNQEEVEKCHIEDIDFAIQCLSFIIQFFGNNFCYNDAMGRNLFNKTFKAKIDFLKNMSGTLNDTFEFCDDVNNQGMQLMHINCMSQINIKLMRAEKLYAEIEAFENNSCEITHDEGIVYYNLEILLKSINRTLKMLLLNEKNIDF